MRALVSVVTASFLVASITACDAGEVSGRITISEDPCADTIFRRVDIDLTDCATSGRGRLYFFLSGARLGSRFIGAGGSALARRTDDAGVVHAESGTVDIESAGTGRYRVTWSIEFEDGTSEAGSAVVQECPGEPDAGPCPVGPFP